MPPDGLVVLLLLQFELLAGVHISLSPDVNAFVVFSARDNYNGSVSEIYLQNGCPSTSYQSVVGSEASRRHFLPLNPLIRNYDCAVSVRIASSEINLVCAFEFLGGSWTCS
ncbi:hypothetical protein AB6A40_009337 [Gnathostoma spinigerum]|uniref:CUB domain-containing protein n=1 Tax=Gnathostoma spinigerum TaxID=75299 RepID=A0ABD6ERQ7_9BILA